MQKKLIVLCLSIVIHSVHCFNIITTGTPKSGLSMLTDTICAIIKSKRKASIVGDVLLNPEQVAQLGNRFDILTGTPVCNEHNRDIVTHYNARVIYIIRDPRDQLCSTAQAIYDHRRYVPGADGKSFDTILSELIEEGSQYYAAQYPFDELYHMHGIADLYALWTPWLEHPNVLVVSFERLSGSEYERIGEIRRIAEFLGVHLTTEKIKTIANKSSSSWLGLFKKQPNIGMWKKKFKAQHTNRFNQLGASLCAQLGYEL